jgi:hypothetical protein
MRWLRMRLDSLMKLKVMGGNSFSACKRLMRGGLGMCQRLAAKSM